MTAIICGVDPGLNGAFALLNLSTHTLNIIDMPTFEKNGKRHVEPVEVGAILSTFSPDHIFLEQVHSSPQMGVASAFSFGRSYGVVTGAAAALQIPTQTVVPSVWKPRMGCSADKGQTAQQASVLLPECADFWKKKKHADRAEAALLALYGCMVLGFTVGTIKPHNKMKSVALPS